jgi:hypothetical protein
MKVWVYPERKWEEFGASRYYVSWEQLKDGKKAGEEIDHDADLNFCGVGFKDKESALKKAKELVAASVPYFGEVTVVRQVVDWFVEEDRVAEWTDTSETEQVS